MRCKEATHPDVYGIQAKDLVFFQPLVAEVWKVSILLLSFGNSSPQQFVAISSA